MFSKLKKYRPNAAVIISDGAGKVLLCYRKMPPIGVVQTVQGGIDRGETALEAAKREVTEEIGLASEYFEIIASSDSKFRYDWPPEVQKRSFERWAGQEQQFFLAQVKPDAIFVLDTHHIPEFEHVEWGMPEEMVEKAWAAKRPGIEAALKEFGLL